VTAAPGGRWPEIGTRALDCVHCGLCLSSCPTYRETGREPSSPRGRLYLFRGVAEGRLPLSELVAEESHLCLGCRACETACPSGVEFGSILEQVRAEVDEAGLPRGPQRWLTRLALRGVVPHRRRRRLLVTALGLLQRLAPERWLLPLLPEGLRQAFALLPRVPGRSERRPLPERIPAEGEPRGRVMLFTGCIASELFAGVNAATARVLAKNGFEVLVPRRQGCCGALHAHAGDEGFARELARRNAAVLREAGVDALVVNSAGCGAALREAGRWLPGEGEVMAAAVRDVTELLDAVGLRPPAGRVDAAVCYDDPCHLVHGQKVRDAPRRVLAAIPGVRLAEHADAASCCGAAGIYNLTHRDMSRAVLARKLDALAAVDPDAIATGNPGCLMQLASGAASRGLRARVVHPVELLDEAYRGDRSAMPSRRIL
jgi:Fe-S oxidoreductase